MDLETFAVVNFPYGFEKNQIWEFMTQADI